MITTAQGTFTVPLVLQVDPLAVTIMRAVANSTKVYAISPIPLRPRRGVSRAYFVEIDALLKRIDRVTPVGTGVTDFTYQPADGRFYITNWKMGLLRAIDGSTFSQVRTYAQPVNAGSQSMDFYRVSAGTAGRLMIEPENRGVELYLLDTASGAVVTTSFQGEGGGAFESSGRYYIHGDDDSTGAGLHKLDTQGDRIVEVASSLAKVISVYGSRKSS